MNIKFKLSKDAKLYITDKYISNGFWAIKRDVINHINDKSIKKTLEPLLNMKHGCYPTGINGIVHGVEQSTKDAFEVLFKSKNTIPVKSAYARLAYDLKLNCVVYEANESNAEIAVNIDFAPLPLAFPNIPLKGRKQNRP